VYAGPGTRFVRHAALLAGPSELPSTDDVRVWHVGPPLVAGGQSAAEARGFPTCRVEIVSDLALTARERNYVAAWLAAVDKERRPRRPFQHYVVHPHVKWQRSETGRRLYRRFSCVGFVVECYRAAEIDILDTDGRYPEVDDATLTLAYPDLARIEDASPAVRARLGFTSRQDLGLHGGPKLRIILPGYVFHALRRATAADPRPSAYLPTSAVESRFP
jgi:hypothetical protein